jgi:diaminohydroxyphosphoribosylaminopyrimidine deaminase/5-amino-6-(5-phosphoribosylamino)uracil reductase
VLADNPQLTCRLPGLEARSPVRVILDARLRTPMATPVISTARETPTWVFASHGASPVAQEILEQKDVRVFRVADTRDRLDIDEVVKVLAAEGITRLMVEGGPTVAAAFVTADLVDEAALFYSEKNIGESGIAPLEGIPLTMLTDRLMERCTEQLGADRLQLYERR